MAKIINCILICAWFLIKDAYSGNLALNKQVIMSSTMNGSVPHGMVDGNKDTVYKGWNCAITDNPRGQSAWIIIDLLRGYFIKSVKLYGRSDYNAGGLDRVTVGVKGWYGVNYTRSHTQILVCGTTPDNVDTTAPIEIQCKNHGRYVIFIQESNSNGHMTICEAEVYESTVSSETNVAMYKIVYMSSTFTGSNPNSIVDGSRDQVWKGMNCAITNNPPNEQGWIAINLLEIFFVTRVKIYGRSDFNGGRLDNVKVGLMNLFDQRIPLSQNHVTVCYTFPSYVDTIQPHEIQCNYMGQFVIFIQEANLAGHMSICEAEVYINPDWSSLNVALRKPVYMSSRHHGSEASTMVDGILKLAWDGGTCAMTDGPPGTENWIAIDLKNIYHVVNVVAYNRKDCCGFRLNNVKVGSITAFDKSSFFLPKRIDECGRFPLSNEDGARIEVACNIVTRYLIFQQQKDSPEGYLAICEAEVYIDIV